MEEERKKNKKRKERRKQRKVRAEAAGKAGCDRGASQRKWAVGEKARPTMSF
jgi:hypothetical protein